MIGLQVVCTNDVGSGQVGYEKTRERKREIKDKRELRETESHALYSMPLIPTMIRKVRKGVCKSSSVANFCASIIACRNLSSSKASGRDIWL